jgi:hypothetical protein
MMKRRTELILVVLGVISVLLTYYFCKWCYTDKETVLKAVSAVLIFNFFMYKLFTGWLIINLDVKIEPERKIYKGNLDHLSLKLTLSKGSTDSMWMERIDIRLSEVTMNGHKPHYHVLGIIHPVGDKKMDPKGRNYWSDIKLPQYTISSGEDTAFTAYTQVTQHQVIAAEVLILGTRPFFGIETFWKKKLIQWRSSAIILPVR